MLSTSASIRSYWHRIFCMDLTGSSTNAYTEHPQSLCTKFYEETHHGRTSPASVGLKYNVALPRIVPALEKVEEVTGFYIDVSRVWTFKGSDYSTATKWSLSFAALTWQPHHRTWISWCRGGVMGENWVGYVSEIQFWKCREVFKRGEETIVAQIISAGEECKECSWSFFQGFWHGEWVLQWLPCSETTNPTSILSLVNFKDNGCTAD